MSEQKQDEQLLSKQYTLLQTVEEYISQRFDAAEVYSYHNLAHTKEVVQAAQIIGAKEGLTEEAMYRVLIAAWFHDVGFLINKQNHEEHSITIFSSFAKDHHCTELIDDVSRLINATRMPQCAEQLDEQVLCDADLYNLSTDLYQEKSDLLLEEMNADPTGEVLTHQDWLKRNVEFFSGHQYHTHYGREVLEPLKQNNIKKIKKSLKKAKKEKKVVEKLEGQVDELKAKITKVKELKPDRGIETMFRLTSRNHLALSAMADNKANIMISINSIILSIVVSVLLRKLDENAHLTIPTLILTLSCLLTIVFAILATRPNVSSGTFTKYDIINKRTNLLFFGNFHSVKLEDYEWGMKEMMKDADYLYSSLIKDIYFLGAVLGKKYKLLRICYTIFMFGFVISVFSFIIAFALHRPL